MRRLLESRRGRADEGGVILIKNSPMSSTERGRRFRENNPGYHARRMATERARVKVAAALLSQQMQVAVARPEPLMLPAPAEPFVLPWLVQGQVVREAVCVER